MAVVQISRIQQRRGRKNLNDIPQLASGELAWAIDTQELYIGNGAVSEGAPYVGNTKIITEHDDILALVDQYQYKRNSIIQTGPGSSEPVRRSLQERLDDVVSLRSFGAAGDGITDDTATLQRAIDELYLNSNKTDIDSRLVLYIEPGKYKISNEIRIPPYVHIIGAGIDSTIIEQTMTSSTGFGVFRTVDGSSTPGHYTAFTSMSSLTTSWPRKIYITGLTLKTTTTNTVLYLDNAETCVFDRIKFEGSYLNTGNIENDQTGITIRGTGPNFRPDNVIFQNCQIVKTGIGVYSNQFGDHQNITFQNCQFFQLQAGIDIGSISNLSEGSLSTKVIGCHFDQINQYGFKVKKGYGNISLGNTYRNVGNNNDNDSGAAFSVILFESDLNNSVGDMFDREINLTNPNSINAFIPAVQSRSMVSVDTGVRHTISNLTAGLIPQTLMRLSVFESGVYIIDYVLKKTANGSAVRTGTLKINANVVDNICSIDDEYNYTGSSSIEDVVFSASIENLSQDSFYDTLILKYTNPVGNGESEFNCSYRMLSR